MWSWTIFGACSTVSSDPGQSALGCLASERSISPSTERAIISKKEAREGARLSCQVAIKQDMEVEVDPEGFETKKWQ